MIIDANNLILGRLGTYAAKKVLLGEKIDIVNCESCVITGNRAKIFKDYDIKLKRGIPAKGPFTHRMPDRFVKRSIRGMLPYKKERGRIAFKNIKCHIGIPENLKNQKFDTLNNANVEKIPNLKYIAIKEICKHIGANIE
ncbi:MAG: 50S ribosomal protein L13 [Candidatus Woesearchaeota archaeon]|jgi:large subunit ribosomal protein L13|nr:50S ribosomal protein L13 [Candidatus Woesearchaeota archaeon]